MIKQCLMGLKIDNVRVLKVDNLFTVDQLLTGVEIWAQLV